MPGDRFTELRTALFRKLHYAVAHTNIVMNTVPKALRKRAPSYSCSSAGPRWRCFFCSSPAVLQCQATLNSVRVESMPLNMRQQFVEVEEEKSLMMHDTLEMIDR